MRMNAKYELNKVISNAKQFKRIMIMVFIELNSFIYNSYNQHGIRNVFIT